MEEYSDLYLVTDVLLFTDFPELYMNTYGLDYCHYVSMPAFSFDAMLRKTMVELKLLGDYDMHLFVEAGIRG
ncbi:hypothetical protein PR048_014465 [Dryococelus australis]|uniref:Uncharacterized protein n=1 Tax=Dryococelus australis TaxID=614101 RepID=A0ABQ9HF36_9NEOP|nr:hypothetical protein PR048_014465 [Dryococelus australis]